MTKSHEFRAGLGYPVGFSQTIDPAREESYYWDDVPADLRAVDIWIGEEANLV